MGALTVIFAKRRTAIMTMVIVCFGARLFACVFVSMCVCACARTNVCLLACFRKEFHAT